MRDNQLVASIVDGDLGALEDAYDKYADILWSYCQSMLGNADDAAEAVLDTFVTAARRLEVLRATERLRAWLYAVARSECRRRLRSSRVRTVSEAPRLREVAAVLSAGEQWQLRAVLHFAFRALDDAERDVMMLVWHGLDLAEVAVVLGVSRSGAYALFTRARDQLEESVSVLLVGWSSQVDCAELDGILHGRDRGLTPDLRLRLSRHICRCAVCRERHRREMRPTLLRGLSMGALLAEASEARALVGTAPIGLWKEVYRMTSERGTEAGWLAMAGLRAAFGGDGFPKPLSADRDGLLTRPWAAMVTAGTAAVAAAAIVFAATGHHAASAGKKTSVPSLSAVVPARPPAPVVMTKTSRGAATRVASAKSRPGLMSHSSKPMSGSSPSTVTTKTTGTTGTTPEPLTSSCGTGGWTVVAGPPPWAVSLGRPSFGQPSGAGQFGGGYQPGGPYQPGGGYQPSGAGQFGGGYQPGGPGRHRRSEPRSAPGRSAPMSAAHM